MSRPPAHPPLIKEEAPQRGEQPIGGDVHQAYSYCRLCLNGCSLQVEMHGGEAVSVAGAKGNPVYRGFTCVKGRDQLNLLKHPDRLRTSLKRNDAGDLVPISSSQAIEEIAVHLERIIEESGPRAVAGYMGTQFAASVLTMPAFMGFMEAINTPMVFSPSTIDKPGKKIALAFHGGWNAPATEFDDPDVLCLVGSNPLVTFTGFPYGNPGKWLSGLQQSGTKLVVIDPRRSDVAKRADIHIQAKPGTDVPILAAMLHVILSERLWDQAFAERHISGIPELSEALASFTPANAARIADVAEQDIVEAARIMASSRRGYINCGTGPNMAGYGSLIEYLALNLHSLCGYWLREGDEVRHPGVLVAEKAMTADVIPPKPAYGFGERMRSRGLGMSAAGMPTGALADEILLPGKGQVRALISCGGNPAGAWPDQNKTVRALEALDLLVQIDPWMSATSRLADYVIAPRIWLEVAGHTQVLDWLTRYGVGYGQSEPYAQYTEALVKPPEGSDLIEEWELFYGLAQRMNRPMQVSACVGPEMPPFALDLEHKPTSEELLVQLAEGSRISLDEVRQRGTGDIFRGEPQFVAPGRSENTNRLDVANSEMLAELESFLVPQSQAVDQEHRFRLVVRRMMHVYNTSWIGALPGTVRPYNPAFMNPDDLAALGIDDGQAVVITGRQDTIDAIATADPSLRRGLVSMAFGFGKLPKSSSDYSQVGSNTARLLSDDDVYDKYSGQPLMTNIPVDVRPAPAPPNA